MATKVVSPGEGSSVERVERKLPVLPSAEAHRIRRAARSYADSLLPLAMARLANMLESEDEEIAWKALDRILKISLAGVANETSDPETAIVDGSARPLDALKNLEDMTSKGTGLPDE